MLIDTHAHLDYPDFDPDRPAVLSRAEEAGVTEIISIGTRLDSSSMAVELAENFPQVWATVGIHPNEAGSVADGYIDVLRRLALSSRVVGIGEIGLDFHRPGEDASLEIQERVFREQLDLAIELGLNVVIHQRDSWDELLRVLRDYTGRLRGVFHCFGGTIVQAEELLDLGHLVSFTGIVTFKNGIQVQEAAKHLPLASFMVETDCPYLAPVPYRGKRCEPAHTRLVADKIASLRGISVEELAAATTAVARDFFRFQTITR